tara:strand:+ start:929 stop:1141 length:213 start_codon:yes stop_codon:yes gene_type:complete
MNIWVEYFKNPESSKNNHAQMRENLKFVEPEPEHIMKRFCQSREEATTFANSLLERGYHTTIKTDGTNRF